MLVPKALFLTSLASLAAVGFAQSDCRCGNGPFLAIPRVNLSTTEQLRPCSPYKMIDARGT
ncbi:hypothetical protein AA0118_g12674 [Alternaria tenuissima]|nr:hypothetical protein AA0118_g12674 [Alternaria tenuissima]